MAGHSKWANIRFRKAAQDAKKGKIFTKLIREITSAARLGGGNGLDLESITYEGYGVGCDLGTSGSDDLEM